MFIEIDLTSKNSNDCMYRFIIDGSHLVKLTPDNISKYYNKKIKMRSPMFCTSEKICNICYGDKAYMIGITNVGLTAPKIGSNFVNLGMKSFHDTSMKLTEIDPNKILL